MTTTLESMVASSRVRVVAGVVWLLGALGSAGLVVAAKAPIHTPTMTMAASLPAEPLNVPVLRALPSPEPMKKPVAVASRRR